jgi:SAM-dependent methyltransferase
MAARVLQDQPVGEHDWHSPEYVNEWIERDVTRDDLRRPLLQKMLGMAPFAREAPIRVLDVGAGYGLVSEQVLIIFPRAQLTLQDFSEPMFQHARRRLQQHANQVTYALSDLRDPKWIVGLAVPFDLVVSGLAIHNLREPSLIRACYRSIREVLSPDGIFLDYDLFNLIPGGVGTHQEWLREAGFARTECFWQEPPVGIVAAWHSSG